MTEFETCDCIECDCDALVWNEDDICIACTEGFHSEETNGSVPAA